MIRFNIDGATAFRPSSWQEIFERTDYRAPIDPKEHPIKDMLAQYIFPTFQPCGLKNCRTLHGKGYVVKVGNQGIVTNIGHICGRKHYGVEYDYAKRRFDTFVNSVRYREQIADKQNHIPSLRRRLERLLNDDTRQVYNKMNRFMTLTLDDRTSRALKEKARRKDTRISRAIELTEEEKEFELRLRRDAQYREELLFTISGIDAPVSYAKLANSRLQTILAEMEAFAKLDPNSLSYQALKADRGWANRIDGRLDDLEAALADCVRFLSPENTAGIIQHKHSVRVR